MDIYGVTGGDDLIEIHDHKVGFPDVVVSSGVLTIEAALAAMSALEPSDLQACIVAGDTATLTRIPGVGRKTAERMVVELRDKLGAVEMSRATSTAAAGDGSARLDALAALESLGLSRSSAEDRIRKVLRDNPGLNTAEQLVKLALKE